MVAQYQLPNTSAELQSLPETRKILLYLNSKQSLRMTTFLGF
jgi:hypothetical protein